MSLKDDKGRYLAGQFGTGFAGGAVTGAAIGSVIPVVGTAIGAVLGGIIGGVGSVLFGNANWENEQKANRDTLAINRNKEQSARNKYIRDARDIIANTRTQIDTTYGAGVFAEYNDIFTSIFSSGYGSSMSNILSRLATDKDTGIINSSVLGYDIDAINGGSVSLQDISANYLEYMRGLMASSDTAFGLQMRAIDNQEKIAAYQYRVGIDSAIADSAKQFSDAFLQQASQNMSSDSALAQAQVYQASSGIRQEGSGQNVTTIQRFSNDISAIAYASLLDYGIKTYEMQMKSASMSFGQQMQDIRNKKSINSLDALQNIINTYNELNSSGRKYMTQISESEEAINEANKQLEEYDEVLGGHSSYDRMEDYFG